MTGSQVQGKEVRLLTPGEVAQLFRVDPKTVTRWAKAGKLTCVRTLGNHRRYVEDEVQALLRGSVAVRKTPQPVRREEDIKGFGIGAVST